MSCVGLIAIWTACSHNPQRNSADWPWTNETKVRARRLRSYADDDDPDFSPRDTADEGPPPPRHGTLEESCVMQM
jgi:hypothetical protein